MKKLLVTAYTKGPLTAEQYGQLAEAMAHHIPALGEKYEVIKNTGREFRGKYTPLMFRKRIDKVGIENISFINIHRKMKEEEYNVPGYSFTIRPVQFDAEGAARLLSVYVPIEAGDAVETIAIGIISTLANVVTLSYAFGVVETRFNVDFEYSSLSVQYVHRRSRGYKIIETAWNQQMKDMTALNAVVHGKQLRSVYPVNVLTQSLATKVQAVLAGHAIDSSGDFKKFAKNLVMWTVSAVADRKRLFQTLSVAGLTFESDWIDLANYKPCNPTIKDVVI